MRKTLILAGVLLSTSAFAQYTKSYADWVHVLPKDTTVRLLEGPISGSFDFDMFNYALCWQVAGSSSEPCSWTPGWQQIYNNNWTYTDTRYCFVNTGVTLEGYGFLENQAWTEINTRNSDQSIFSRRYAWSIWTDEKVYLR